jgi:hypothetical protein
VTRLEAGGRADGVVLFDRPNYKQSTEKLYLQLAQADKIDQPVLNNVNGAYSESDMIRERAADNLGMATDSQLMQLNGGTHISVSVPANTKIYVVWTQHHKGPDASTTAKAHTTP